MGPNGSGKTTLGLRADGPPRLRRHRRQGHLEGPRHPRADARQARPPRIVPRLPVPDGDPRPQGRVVHPLGAQREAPGHRQGRRHRPDRPGPWRRLDARIPRQDAREDGPPADGRELRQPLRQRGLLGRREEAPRDAPDGGHRARDGHPRRDRLGPRHRRAADRGRGRQRDAQPGPGRAPDHPLPAAAQPHHARRRPRPRPGPHRQERRQGPRPPLEEEGYGPILREAGLETTAPDEALQVPKGPDLDRDAEASASRWRPPAGAPWPSRRPTSTTTRSTRRAPARLPDPRPGDQRPSARLPRLGVVEPEAARRHRRGRRLLPRVQRQRPPRDLHHRRAGDRRLRAGARERRPVHQRARQPRDRVHPQRDRGHQPRRLLVGSAATSGAATRSS